MMKTIVYTLCEQWTRQVCKQSTVCKQSIVCKQWGKQLYKQSVYIVSKIN